MPTPAQVVIVFQQQITSAIGLHDQLLEAIAGHSKKKPLENTLVEQLVLGVTVLWEGFIHDLIVAYVEQRPEECVRYHRDRVTQSIREKNQIFLTWMTINVPAVLTKSDIELMVDPKGWNITAESAAVLTKLTNQILAGAIARKFALNEPDGKFFDFAVSIRNYLSHRSAGSLAILRTKLADFQKVDKASPLRGKLTDVGPYLSRQLRGAPGSRAKVIAQNLGALAAKLI
ncbi:MAG: hypothetical protein ABSG65_04665 [Bryobacteraceae bacterium]|jgi:hypothetical protein